MTVTTNPHTAAAAPQAPSAAAAALPPPTTLTRTQVEITLDPQPADLHNVFHEDAEFVQRVFEIMYSVHADVNDLPTKAQVLRDKDNAFYTLICYGYQQGIIGADLFKLTGFDKRVLYAASEFPVRYEDAQGGLVVKVSTLRGQGMARAAASGASDYMGSVGDAKRVRFEPSGTRGDQAASDDAAPLMDSLVCARAQHSASSFAAAAANGNGAMYAHAAASLPPPPPTARPQNKRSWGSAVWALVTGAPLVPDADDDQDDDNQA